MGAEKTLSDSTLTVHDQDEAFHILGFSTNSTEAIRGPVDCGGGLENGAGGRLVSFGVFRDVLLGS